MTVQITIVGLGQIGGSIGLALANHKDQILRIGHDRDTKTAQKAEKIGAVDKISLNLHSAVKGADAVILALPQNEIKDTLKIIGDSLREGAVVFDTAVSKTAVAQWAAEFLPKERHYIALLPVLNHNYLYEATEGIDAAKADLFQNQIMMIAAPPHAHPDAVAMASDLAQLLGAHGLFSEVAEIDGLMAATHILPQLVAAALVNATIDQPGWIEGRKVAGRAFSAATRPLGIGYSSQTLLEESLENKENTLRVLNNLITSLQALREDLSGDNSEKFETLLEQAQQKREKWLQERQAADWGMKPSSRSEIPKSRDVLKQFFLGVRPRSDKDRG
jgi:prephenate dehydrogenase